MYVIEKKIDGVRFHVSTRCSDLERAMRHLMRFEADPVGYTPAGKEARVAELRLSAQLVTEYHEHQVKKGLTKEWAAEMARVLADWVEAIGHLDLRRLSLHQDLKPALEQWPKRKSQRIKALKGFFRWLRTEKGLITHSQDATLDLRVPVGRPEKWKRRKVVGPEDVQAVLTQLSGLERDVLHLLTATAWHVSEVRRFVFMGEIVMVAQNKGIGGALAVLMTRHKSGEIVHTRLDYLEHVETARRLLALRSRPGFRWPKSMTFCREMRRACAAAEVPYFPLGVMRHSVLTWAHEAGAPMHALKEFAHHKTESTTRRFYVDAAVPVNAVPVLRLLP